MLRDERVEVVSTWARETDNSIGHREIDRELRRIAKRRAGLDVEEARWLREAEKQRVWRTLGFSTALEYLEDVFGDTRRAFGDVVTLQTAKRTLIDLGYTTRAAGKALEQVSAHVGTGTDVATLVQAVLARGDAGRDRRSASGHQGRAALLLVAAHAREAGYTAGRERAGRNSEQHVRMNPAR